MHFWLGGRKAEGLLVNFWLGGSKVHLRACWVLFWLGGSKPEGLLGALLAG